MSKKLTKKEKKILKNKENLVFELSLLVSGFSYLMHQYKNISMEELNQGIAIKAKSTMLSLGLIIDTYKELHKEALANYNKALNVVDTKNANVFLISLSLIGEHLELKNKMINVFTTDSLNDLIDYATSNIETESVERTFAVAREIRDFLGANRNKMIKKALMSG